MKKFIVTTTIYEPSEATLKYASMKDWTLVIVGDLKTPHDSYLKLASENENVKYLHPSLQQEIYSELSDAIGWNCVMRRNIGFVYAHDAGADIVATIDDDNIPYDNWGKRVVVGQRLAIPTYTTDNNLIAFDPLQGTNHPELWHRGYPLELVGDSQWYHYAGEKMTDVLFQADLWDGDPDIDAVCRLLHNPTNLELELTIPFGSSFSSLEYAPFNSQNTFIAREALPYYMVLPHVGRMDDIWGGYIAQYLLNTRPVFMPPTVKQERNVQSVYKNLRDEVLGYTTTLQLLNDIENWEKYLPDETLRAFTIYRRQYE